jgi:hypothetical protein
MTLNIPQHYLTHDSRNSWAMGWTIGILEFDSRRGLGIFLFTTASRTALGLTQPPIQWVPGTLSLGVKWPGREADHSPPSSCEVKNEWSYTFTPPIRLHGVVHRDNFNFTTSPIHSDSEMNQQTRVGNAPTSPVKEATDVK